MRPTPYLLLAGIFFGFLTNSEAAVQSKPQRVLYLSGVQTLVGYLYKPEGKGPFPSVVFSQAGITHLSNTGTPDPYPALAQIFTRRGYAFFVPGRHAAGQQEQQEEDNSGGKYQKMLENNEKHGANLAAAIMALKTQSFIDETRVVVLADGGGAVATLLAAQEINVNGIILCSPGAQALKHSHTFQNRLMTGVQNAKAPIFLIQVQNDHNLLPTEVLGAELQKKLGANRVKVFPAYGETPGDARRFITEGYTLWQGEIMEFIRQVNDKSLVQKGIN